MDKMDQILNAAILLIFQKFRHFFCNHWKPVSSEQMEQQYNWPKYFKHLNKMATSRHFVFFLKQF